MIQFDHKEIGPQTNNKILQTDRNRFCTLSGTFLSKNTLCIAGSSYHPEQGIIGGFFELKTWLMVNDATQRRLGE